LCSSCECVRESCESCESFWCAHVEGGLLSWTWTCSIYPHIYIYIVRGHRSIFAGSVISISAFPLVLFSANIPDTPLLFDVSVLMSHCPLSLLISNGQLNSTLLHFTGIELNTEHKNPKTESNLTNDSPFWRNEWLWIWIGIRIWIWLRLEMKWPHNKSVCLSKLIQYAGLVMKCHMSRHSQGELKISLYYI